MDTQQAYEMMRVYLTRPGARRAADVDNSCMYETEMDGEIHRCAIGCLLSPEGLSETVEIGDMLIELREVNGGLDDLFGYGFKVPELAGVDRGFLAAAQELHDTKVHWAYGVFRVALLDELAEDAGLKVVIDDRAPQEEAVLVG